MPSVIISDTSCLIILSKIGELNLLSLLYGKVTITPEISSEYGNYLPDWIKIQQVTDSNWQELLELLIDKGEASAIALALEIKADLIILDDWKARKVAEKLSIKITGTLGIIIKAKQAGIIHSIKPFLSKIRETDFRISDELEQIALREANEI